MENVEKLEEGLNKWKELLLNGRKIFIEAGSDAHGDFNSGFGKVRTAVLTPDFSNNGILSGLRDGHSIMTDGPLVVFDLNSTIIGDTIVVPEGNRINMNIQWNSTYEFGFIYNITIIKGIIGYEEIIEQEIYPFSYSGTRQIILTATQDDYFRLMAFTSDGHRIYTNPIWIKIFSTRTSPGSVENLMNTTYGRTYINWTWTNPPDPDFSHVMLYLNGTFITSIPAPQNYYNFTGLQLDTLYELETHTVDSSGNVNETWVNATARTLPSGAVPPIADCGADKPKCENVGAPVQFNGSASYDPDGAALSYYWDFGDGMNAMGAATRHTYASYRWNGTGYEPFIANLTVTDDSGLINTTSQKVVIWIAGDANGDGNVNILDASVVGLKWGGNDPCADLNNDGVVNILDASIIGLNWGKSAIIGG